MTIMKKKVKIAVSARSSAVIGAAMRPSGRLRRHAKAPKTASGIAAGMAVGLYPDATFGAMVAPVVGMMGWRVLELVVGVEEGVVALLPLYDFLVAEETLELDGCGLGRVGCVDDILLETHAV